MADKEIIINNRDLTTDVAIPLAEPAPINIEVKPGQPVTLPIKQTSILANDSLY